ncbi:MAG: cell division protein FtsZ [Owenweeksia sp.]
MSDQNQNDTISFDLPKNQSSVIKVIGVGGGGSNAVNHMFSMGIRGVDFAVCNTDAQALSNSPVPNKIQLGVTLTEGLGAGANPQVGEQSAQESIQEIKSLLETNTKMVFITAGMGGGTGTGAAPIIAKTAKELGVLTVGIVTMPFLFEGNNRKQQAERGVEALRSNVDSLIVINNNKLREVYGNLGFKAGFAKADEVLATAARGIAEVITHHYTTNIDLRDARTVLADSGTAIMGSSTASGETRASDAISSALDSPLLNDNHIKGAKNVLLLIVSGQEEITIDEIGEINDHIQIEAGGSANIIMGIGEDESLGKDIAVTIVATGFAADQQVQVIGGEPQKVVHTLEDEQAVSTSVYNKPIQHDTDDEDDIISSELAKSAKEENKKKEQVNLFDFETEDPFEAEIYPAKPQEDLHASDVEEEIMLEETTRFELEEDIPTEAESAAAEAETPQEETAEEMEPVFSIGDTEEEKAPEAEFEMEEPEEEIIPQQPEAETKTEEPVSKKQPQQQPEETIRYSLEDYLHLEQHLKSAGSKREEEKPKADKPKPEEVEDEDLRFEIKQVSASSKQDHNPRPSGNVSPVDSPIEEGMRLKANERRAKLKAFNYRFKNHPFSVDDTDNEPAYKRQGVNIENEKYSKEGRISRFSIDDSEDGSQIKTNNSFLHDNVD